MSPAAIPNIFTYHDFRLYLADIYAYRRSLDRGFTKSHVCAQIGLKKSRSYFQDVLNGKMVSKSKVEEFIRLFELKKDEAKYFRLMVNFNQATDSPDERELYFNQLIGMNKAPKKLVPNTDYTYYGQWFYPVVRAVLNIHDIRDDYAELARLVYPPLTFRQAEEAMRLLRDLKLISQNADGFWKPAEKNLSTGPLIQDEIVRQYQLKRLEEAQRVLLRGPKFPHRVITRTVSVSEEGFQRLKAKIEKISEEISALVNADERPADRAYQLDILFYPCSKPRSTQ